MSRNTASSPITVLNGVGKTTAARLTKLGIHTLRDLVYFFPRAYEKRSDIRPLSKCIPDTPCAFMLTVATEVRTAQIRRGMSISKLRAFDDSGSVEIIFFNSAYVKDIFHIGSTFRFYGKPSMNKNKLQLVNPKYEPYVEGISLPDFTPIYPLTDGITSKQIDKLMKIAINDVLPTVNDPLPDALRIKNELPTLSYALTNSHFPDNTEALKKSIRRLAFDEMLAFGIGVSLMSSQRKRSGAPIFSPCSLTPLTELLPYELTRSQKDAINDIYRDTVLNTKTGASAPMARIIVGDVGCGKTVCAIAAMYIAVRSGYQSALMVPTEILARQHYADASELLGRLGIRTEILLGSTTQKDKKRIYTAIESGEVDVVIGTHALISEKVDFSNLGLVITDEQHRFGVSQRARLKEKSQNAHMLVMSATPIPRTLALTMYGDLDISRITEMPKGRQRVDTFVVDEAYRERINDFIKKQVALGGRCYIVCPSIDPGEDTDDQFVLDGMSGIEQKTRLNLKNVVEYTDGLQKAIPEIAIATLHGKMSATEKDGIMNAFSKGDIQVLVSTTVIEVGVNVPEATLMIVENAERFGLSQLHQLRGRVGRGNKKSYCILVSDLKSDKSSQRLEVMRTTYDGFEIAEKDLAMRGPGDFFATNRDVNMRQSGGFEFKFATMCDDTELFDKAFSAAKDIITADPTLELPDHAELRKSVEEAISRGDSTLS